MKYPKWDFYSLSDAVFFGVRPSITMNDEGGKWEVYVKLSNGNTVVTAKDGEDEAQARKALERMLRRLQQADMAFLLTMDGSFVDMTRLIRVFVDAQLGGYVALAEDVTGEVHRLAEGDRDECRDVVMDIVGILSTLQPGEDNDEQEQS